MSTVAPPTAKQAARSSPYQGLRPYTEEDAEFFFGRDEWRDIIIDNLLAHPLTLLYGESGVGKSSVLRAGVVPELRRRHEVGDVPPLAAAVFDDWRESPIERLTDCMVGAVAEALGGQTPPAAEGGLSERLDALADELAGRLIVILDQFELYFAYHGRSLNGTTLAAELPRAVGEHGLRVHYLVAIREDALAKLDAFQNEIPGLFDNLLRIAPLDRSAATDAIVEPVARYNELFAAGVSVEPQLIATVLDEIEGVAGGLEGAGRGAADEESGGAGIQAPYLQLVMERLWTEEVAAHSNSIRLATLEHLGGSRSIVRHHLDTTMAALSPQERVVAAYIFHYLVTPSGTKFAHTAPDLAEYTDIPSEAVGAVLEKLAAPEVRIIRRVAPPPRHGAEQEEQPPRYEIFHDALGPAVLDWRVRQLAALRPSLRRVFVDLRKIWLLTLLVNTLTLGSGCGVFVLVPLLRRLKPPIAWKDVGRIVVGFILGGVIGAILGASIGAVLKIPFSLSKNTENLLIGFGALLGADLIALFGAMIAARKPNLRRMMAWK